MSAPLKIARLLLYLKCYVQVFAPLEGLKPMNCKLARRTQPVGVVGVSTHGRCGLSVDFPTGCIVSNLDCLLQTCGGLTYRNNVISHSTTSGGWTRMRSIEKTQRFRDTVHEPVAVSSSHTVLSASRFPTPGNQIQKRGLLLVAEADSPIHKNPA